MGADEGKRFWGAEVVVKMSNDDIDI